MKNRFTVKDALELMKMGDDESIRIIFTAYGIDYADTARDGLKTVKQCKDELNWNCLHAQVTETRADDEYGIIVVAELVS